MSIRYAVLGFLSREPLSGYDLKKRFVDSIASYWSGNNNQIYRTLVELHHEGLVTVEYARPVQGPVKKIYTVTEKGLTELGWWLGGKPEPPLIRNSFLLRLAWADRLTNTELLDLISRYEREIENELLMCRERIRREEATGARTAREAFLWRMIGENLSGTYENELRWVRTVREGLTVGS